MVVSGKALALGFLAMSVLAVLLALVMYAIDAGPSVVALGFIGLCVVAGLLAGPVVDRPVPSKSTRSGAPAKRH